MKIIVLIIISFISSALFSQSKEATINRLNSLYNMKQFFKLRDDFKASTGQLDDMHNKYYNSILLSAFNKPSESNALIEKLTSESENSLTDSMYANIYECRLINCVNLFQYMDALKASQVIIEKYKDLVEPKMIEDFQNSALIWNGASQLSPQTVTISGDTKLEAKKDLAGLMNIKVNINNNEEDFIFDTGANFSTISKSYAKKLGMKFIEGTIDVETSTDKKVKSELAYAESVIIGNLTFSNVLFLVLEDEALSFAGGAYVINGIIGFPVIKEMKEISISDNEIFIPSTAGKSPYENLSLDDFLPLINTIVNSDTLVFAFDTGAKSTILYYPYYIKYKDEIESKYKAEDIKIGGAGGEIVIQGYKLNDMDFTIASGSTKLNNISVLTKSVRDDDKYLYGNLGGDYIHSFKKMIINFENMYVEFEN